MKKLPLEFQMVTKTYLKPTDTAVVKVVTVATIVTVLTVVKLVAVVTEVTVWTQYMFLKQNFKKNLEKKKKFNKKLFFKINVII